MTNKKFQIGMITAGDKKTASRLARGLVKNNLAACVSIIPQIKSIYAWNGKIEEANEHFLIAKTRSSLSKKIISFVQKNHTYSNPEIIFLNIEDGSKNYLDWIKKNT
ncbi:MAG: divalent-cation tolerance protein CutA [Elusimicrobiales bacterium]|nr:divalent-cation tolerance protein CutA [Elusimicrobiales bacterium]MCK5583669.1 divalent-cation tolerance protein CutA [Elusimicrobiales bacterium]